MANKQEKSSLEQEKLLHQSIEGIDECIYCGESTVGRKAIEECSWRKSQKKTVDIFLKNEEGFLIMLHRTNEKLREEQIKDLQLNEVIIFHGTAPFCGGIAKIVKVFPPKKVIFCPDCGLRISFPANIQTVKALEKYLTLYTHL